MQCVRGLTLPCSVLQKAPCSCTCGSVTLWGRHAAPWLTLMFLVPFPMLLPDAATSTPSALAAEENERVNPLTHAGREEEGAQGRRRGGGGGAAGGAQAQGGVLVVLGLLWHAAGRARGGGRRRVGAASQEAARRRRRAWCWFQQVAQALSVTERVGVCAVKSQNRFGGVPENVLMYKSALDGVLCWWPGLHGA